MWKREDWRDSELVEPLVRGPAHGVEQVLASLPPARARKEEEPQEEGDLDFFATVTSVRGARPAPVKPAELDGDEENDGKPIIISVDPNKTTLQGIALQYNVTTDALRKANGLTSDRLNSHFSLIIPRPGQTSLSPTSDPSRTTLGSEAMDPSMWIMRDETEARKRNAMEDAFVSMTRCRAGLPEARFYLSEHRYKLEEALAHFEKDAQWEKQRRGPSFWSPWQ